MEHDFLGIVDGGVIRLDLATAHERGISPRPAQLLRFFMRGSPTGAAGLCYEGRLPLEAHWALHGFQRPEPEDGECPEAPRAPYDRASLAQASRDGFPFGRPVRSPAQKE